MYSITNIIYGVPLTKKISAQIEAWEENEEEEKWFEDERGTCGFTILYHGGADQHIGYCGVELDEFDEASFYIKPSNLNTDPTQAQIEEAQKLYKQLQPELKQILEHEGVKLDIYYIHSTS